VHLPVKLTASMHANMNRIIHVRVVVANKMENRQTSKWIFITVMPEEFKFFKESAALLPLTFLKRYKPKHFKKYV